MRFISSSLRALTVAGSVTLLSLWSVCAADAAPRRGTSGPRCDPQTPVARKLPRHPRSFGGPLKQPSSHVMAGLQDITVRMVRGNRAYLAVGVVAIQNDSPVNGTGGDDRLTP